MKDCRDSAFSLCGLAVGLPAFRLPMFEKKEICLTLSKTSMPFVNLSLHSLPEGRGP